MLCRHAKSNMVAIHWVVDQGTRDEWVKQARWVEDGKFFTSSGVSAGIDMALAVIGGLTRTELAEQIATFMEYDWHRDSAWDPFAKVHGPLLARALILDGRAITSIVSSVELHSMR